MYLALVRYGMVRTIAVGDADFMTYASTLYDEVIDVTDVSPRPVQGDSYYAETGQFVCNHTTDVPLADVELDAAIPEGPASGFDSFQMSNYSVTFQPGTVTIGCMRFGARGLLQSLYEVLVEHETTVAQFHTMDAGPAHGRYGITWVDAEALYAALTSLRRDVL